MTTTRSCKMIFQLIWFWKVKKKNPFNFLFFRISCLMPQAQRPVSSANFQLLHLPWNCLRVVSCCFRMVWLRSCWGGWSFLSIYLIAIYLAKRPFSVFWDGWQIVIYFEDIQWMKDCSKVPEGSVWLIQIFWKQLLQVWIKSTISQASDK